MVCLPVRFESAQNHARRKFPLAIQLRNAFLLPENRYLREESLASLCLCPSRLLGCYYPCPSFCAHLPTLGLQCRGAFWANGSPALGWGGMTVQQDSRLLKAGNLCIDSLDNLCGVHVGDYSRHDSKPRNCIATARKVPSIGRRIYSISFEHDGIVWTTPLES
jgi:hypothetical protein